MRWTGRVLQTLRAKDLLTQRSSVCSRGHGAGCLAEGLWIGLRSAWLQLWAESWSACQPLYGNKQGQSKGSVGQEFGSMFLERAAVCRLLCAAAPIAFGQFYILVSSTVLFYCLDFTT